VDAGAAAELLEAGAVVDTAASPPSVTAEPVVGQPPVQRPGFGAVLHSEL
jgi:hypothetical protein